MSKISKEGYEQIKVIKNALDSMYDKLVASGQFDGCVWGYCAPVSIVNQASYSDEDGMAYTMMGVYQSNIGDTATIYCGYYDNWGVQYLDSIRVIIDE